MNYNKLLKFDMNNGPGVRETIWVTGCDLHCPGCFNYELQDPNAGMEVTDKVIKEILKGLEPDYMSGFTFLGGDPLFITNQAGCMKIAKAIKQKYGNKKSVWLWTGYLWDNVKTLPIFDYVDVCVDGPFVESLKDNKLKYSGSSNQRVIDVRKTLSSETQELVLIPNKE